MLCCVLYEKHSPTVKTWLTQGSGIRISNNEGDLYQFDAGDEDLKALVGSNPTPFRRKLLDASGRPIRVLHLDGHTLPIRHLQSLQEHIVPESGKTFAEVVIHPAQEELHAVYAFFRRKKEEFLGVRVFPDFSLGGNLRPVSIEA